MKNWTGTTIQADALTVQCPDCHAPAGEVCRTDHGPLTAFPAHARRIRITQESQEANR